MNGFTGRSGPVMRPGVAPAGAAGGAGAAGAAGATGARAAGEGAGRGGAATGGGGADVGAAMGPEKRGIAGARGGAGAGAGGAGAAGGAGGRGAEPGPPGAAGDRCGVAEAAFTGNTLLPTAHRARTPPAGTLDGSTRYTVSHDGQVTFIWRPPRLHRAPGRAGGRPRTPTPVVFSRSSSSPWRARSLEPGVRNGGAGSSRCQSTGSSGARGAVARADPCRSSIRHGGPARCTGTESACRTPRAPRRTRRGSHRTGC